MQNNQTISRKSYALPIAMMFALLFLIAFVTNLAGSMGVILKNQFETSNAVSQLGTFANFLAYAFMGVPAGIILKRKGYKFTSLLAIAVGIAGVGIQCLSGVAGSFAVYVAGAFVAGFSMCMLNVVAKYVQLRGRYDYPYSCRIFSRRFRDRADSGCVSRNVHSNGCVRPGIRRYRAE